MAAAGFLSSSPAQMAHKDSVVVISSSPEFPSIRELLPKATKKPPLRSGSNAAPVPADAPTAFTSAASIWQSSRLDYSEDNSWPDVQSFRNATSAKPSAGPAVELAPKPATESANCELRKKTETSKPRAAGTTRKKNMEQSESGDAKALPEASVVNPPTKKAVRKPKSTKAAAMAQTTLPKGKVTKPAAKETQPKKKAETVSRHFAPQVSAPAPADLIADPIEDGSVILEPAMRRRMDWTPPRESVATRCLADSSAAKELSASLGPAQGDVFKTLQDTYGRNTDDPHVNTSVANPDVLGKRKLIEMVAAAGNRQKTPEDSPTKPKAVKKKPRTITELATAAYRLPVVDDAAGDEPKQDSLVGYLEGANAPAKPTSKAAGAKGRAPRKPTKPRAKPAKKKEQPPKPVLLSPTTAMRQVARQDFVFGTASQLATEEDPELLRALHEAMKVSNQADSDPFVSPNLGNGNLAIRRRQGAGLWAAGARFDGEMLDMEVLDLTRSSPLVLAHLPPKAPCADQQLVLQGPSKTKPCIDIEMSDDAIDVSNSPVISHPKQALPPAPRPASQVITLDDSSPLVNRPQTPTHEPDFEPPPSNQEQHQLLLSQSNSPRQEKPAPPPPPHFELYTDARLAKEVTAYGFKAMKKRTAMIALLNQCWESKNKTGLGRTGRANMSTSSANQLASPSRPRGRPRKDASAPVSDTAEAAAPAKRGKKSVSVSDAECEPPHVEKRPRGRPRKNSTTPLSDVAEAPVPAKRGRKKATPASDVESEPPQAQKRPRGRPKKDVVAPPAKPSTQKAPASPKRAKSPTKPAAPTPRQRKTKPPPKSKSQTAIEIPDSDSEADPFLSTAPSTPSTHPVAADELFSSPPAMDLSITDDTETSLLASPTTQQVSLFRYITQAVVAAPRSADPTNPSWHEKMLMYDPVILEDLTAWLNAGQLDRVGYEGEVAPGDVKRWCESRSVCCLWRVNLRGKERKRL